MLQVAIGVVCRLVASAEPFNNQKLPSFSHILISQRSANQSMPGYWEFPGGKFELGESAEQALARELQEELAIEPVQTQPMLTLQHQYTQHLVELHVYWVLAYQGLPVGREGQQIRWVLPADLKKYQFPEGNQVIIEQIMQQGARLDPFYSEPSVN